jgi:hypothetical protein
MMATTSFGVSRAARGTLSLGRLSFGFPGSGGGGFDSF